MDIVKLHRAAVEFFDEKVRQIGDDQWGNPTPCSEWDVRALVNHVVNEDLWTVPLLEGKTIEEVGDRFDGDVLGEDPQASWAEASKQAVDIAATTPTDKMVNVSWGQIPAREYLSQLFMDHLIHGWDLAKGIGADTQMDPELVEPCYDIAKQAEDMIRASGVFGDAQDIPDDADTQTKLLAILGRSD